MNGILEQILAALVANTAALNALAALRGGPLTAAQMAAPAALQPQAAAALQLQAAAAQAANTAAAQPITADAITALIQPHIANDAIKTALGVAMRAMGINALPETQQHQFGALYAAFQNVIAQHTGAGVGQAQQSASII